MLGRLRELVWHEGGQDLVEYGLLAFFVALAALLVWQAVAAAVGVAYGGYDAGVQDLWEPLPPPAPTPTP